MTVDEEKNLIGKCRSGDQQAFGEIYDAYVRKIHDFVYFRTHHRETAQDLTSEVFLKAVKGLDGFDPARGSISSWLYRIARNTVIDHYRTRHAEMNIDDAWDLTAGSDAGADIDALMKIDSVRGELKKLKSEQREIVIMRVWQELSYKEIADILGKSEASCKMSFSRSMKQLRANLPLAALLAFIITKL